MKGYFTPYYPICVSLGEENLNPIMIECKRLKKYVMIDLDEKNELTMRLQTRL
jgi:hypothetical protein